MNDSSAVKPCPKDFMHRAPRGVTLIEAVLSLAILGIIMASIGAATSVLMRLMPRSDDPRTVAIAASSLLERFDSDITAAIAVQQNEPDALRMLVAGLGEASTPAAVVYKYDAEQATIYRGIDSNPLQPILAGISSAEFGYTTIERASGEAVEPKTFDTNFGTDEISCSSIIATLESGRALRQRIEPEVDDDVSLWTIESISLRLKQHVLFGGGTFRISFHHMNDDGTMNPTPFAQRNIAISSLPLSTSPAERVTYDFEDMPWIERDQTVAVLLSAVDGSLRAHLASSDGRSPVDFVIIATNTATPLPGYLLCFQLKGSVMVPGDEPVPTELIQSITLLIEHPTLGDPMLQEARPPVPIVIEP